jgi:PAS domain S-box-containing protein
MAQRRVSPGKDVTGVLPGKMSPKSTPPVRVDADTLMSCTALLNAMPFYVLIVDEHHNIIAANQAVTKHLGVRPEEVVGRYCPEAIHGTKEPWYACPLEEVVEKGEAVVREAQDKNTGRWISSAMYPIPTAPGGRRLYFHMVTDINDRKQAEEQLKASREQLSELSNHLETVREEERTSIAREIHDELGQTLVTLKVYLAWLLKRLPQVDTKVGEQIKPMYDLIDSAIKTVMRLSTELRPGALDDFGLVPAIEWQINEFKKWTSLEYHFDYKPADITLDRETATTLFRIAHEALTNVIRHAQATHVGIFLKKTARRVELSVSDDGKGVSEAQVNDSRAFGLVGMRERARLRGGEVKISGAPGKGTVVLVTLPIAEGQAEAAPPRPKKKAKPTK